MDPQRFDSLVRTLTAGGSRRRLLGLLGALPLLGSLTHAEDVAANKRRRRRARSEDRDEPTASCVKRCRKKNSKQARRRCRKRCQSPPECATNQDCPTGELCEGGVCIPISDQCTTDADCDACERCEGGVCLARCQGEETCCRADDGGETCCAPGDACQDGQCLAPECREDADCRECSRCVAGRCRWQCSPTERCLSGTGRCCQPRGCPAGTDCGTVDDHCGGQARCGADTCAQPSNPCQQTTCQANVCTTGPGHDGAACDDGNACTTNTTCTDGSCGGGTVTTCTSPPVCHTSPGTCDPQSGACTYPPEADGTSCDDGTLCTTGTTCSGGSCGGGTPVVCDDPPECHTAVGATCDPGTGACIYPVTTGAPCQGGRTCLGTGRCAMACETVGAPCASPCGDFTCQQNLDGGPAAICFSLVACTAAGCADCTANGLACVQPGVCSGVMCGNTC